MTGFGLYFWRLLSRPFKLKKPGETSGTERWAEAAGNALDNLKQAMFKTRRARIVATADDKAIDLLGYDRGVVRYPGEQDRYYRRRVQSAYIAYQRGGTNAGVIAALSAIGYPGAVIYEIIFERAYYDGRAKHNGRKRYSGEQTKWAEFDITVFLEPGRQFAPVDFLILLDAIMKAKAAHAKPRFLTLQYSAFEFKYNGLYRYNGSFQHKPDQVNLTPYYNLAAGKVTLKVQGTGG
jgi:hypothetical protein